MTMKQKKGPNYRFIESWSLGMNDYAIAKSFGVNIETLRTVKKDLCDEVTPENHLSYYAPWSDPSR
jgi:hypothetical protein